MSTPRPTMTAKRSVMFMSSYLDGDHAPDDQVSDEDHEDADRDEDPPDEVLEHGAEVSRRHEVHEDSQHDGQEGDQGARGSRLSSQRRDLTLDPHAFPN